MNAKPAL